MVFTDREERGGGVPLGDWGTLHRTIKEGVGGGKGKLRTRSGRRDLFGKEIERGNW